MSQKSAAAANPTLGKGLLRFRITGTAPLLLRNGLIADQANPRAMALKQITSKRIKTESDAEELAHREWLASLYLVDGKPIMPSRNLWSALHVGARKTRQGPLIMEGVFIDGLMSITHNGPEDIKDLWADKRFVHQCMMPLGDTRIKRTRPIFERWEITADVHFLTEIIDAATLIAIAQTTGYRVGLGDWRPRFGRFSVEVVEAQDKP
jgi:hypothetical protein